MTPGGSCGFSVILSEHDHRQKSKKLNSNTNPSSFLFLKSMPFSTKFVNGIYKYSNLVWIDIRFYPVPQVEYMTAAFAK